MVVILDPKLEAALESLADREGITPEELALKLLRDRLLPSILEPRDDWERELLESARSWGVSFSDEAIHDLVRGTGE